MEREPFAQLFERLQEGLFYVVSALLFVIALSFAITSQQPRTSPSTTKVLRVKRVEIVDETGTVRSVICSHAKGAGLYVPSDEAPLAMLAVNSRGTPIASVFSPPQNLGAILYIDQNGKQTLAIGTKDAQTIVTNDSQESGLSGGRTNLEHKYYLSAVSNLGAIIRLIDREGRPKDFTTDQGQ